MVPREFLWATVSSLGTVLIFFKNIFSVDLGPCALGSIAIVIELYGFLHIFFLSAVVPLNIPVGGVLQ